MEVARYYHLMVQDNIKRPLFLSTIMPCFGLVVVGDVLK